MFEAALEYASEGWAVLPVKPRGKVPLTSHGVKDATTDQETIQEWLRSYPNANIGLAVPVGSLVLDVDSDDALHRLKHEERSLPATATARTGRGYHFWYSAEGVKVRNGVNVVPGVDIRAVGGYVIVSPSVHENGSVYEWTVPLEPINIAPAPEWLLELLGKKEPAPGVGQQSVNVAQVLAGVPEGQRDDQLFRLACKLRHVDVPRPWAERLVQEAAVNCSPPLPEREALAKVTSAYSRYQPGQASVGSVGSVPAPFGELRVPPQLPDAPSLPPELLPPPLHGWLVDVAERMQVPLEFVAVSALVSVSAVVGRSVGIHPKAKDDWLVVPNLWGAVIAPPGWLKSPALAEALSPIKRLAAEARKEYEGRLTDDGARLESLKVKESALKGLLKKAYSGKEKRPAEELESELSELRREFQELEDNLVQRRFIVNDPTVEKLGELLAQNPRGLLLERDELAGWIRSLERDDRKADREFYLEAWNGTNSYTYDRIGRGTIHAPALCLSIIGGIQPTKLKRTVSDALSGGYAADGLLQRFQLLVWPESTAAWQLIDRQPDKTARERALGILQALDQCQYELPQASDDDIPAFRFAPDAQELFFSWLPELEQRLRTPEAEEHAAFTSHLAKYRSLMPSLALIFHLIEVVDAGQSGPVSLTAAQRAADWCDFLEQHARKIYASELQADLAGAHALGGKIRKRAVFDGMTVRDVYRHEWAGLKTGEVVRAAARVLEDHGWLQVTVEKTGGRSSQVLRINPAALEKAQ
ncbi:MAG: DUF3987 domain-containing protein [bacterium]|nr:DUF3987 domain-containing protein [bacterium]